MYWINKRCYKTLEGAIAAYEEYKKNERILNGEGLTYLPHNLSFHNHYQEVVPGVIEEISAYDMLGNKIATWGTPSQNNHMANYDVSTTKPIEMFSLTNNIPASSFEKANAPGKIYDLPKSYNCRNCGAPLRSCTCEYCGTRY